MTEIWKSLKDIVECGDNYEISNLGRIKNCKTNNILKSSVKSNGYYYIDLYLKSKRKKYHIHRLVALAFIPNLENKPEVNHVDGDKSNNSVENLEWHTRLENVNHSYETGLKNQSGSNNHMSKISESDVIRIRELYETGDYLQRDLVEMFGLTKQTISLIVNRKTWKHI